VSYPQLLTPEEKLASAKELLSLHHENQQFVTHVRRIASRVEGYEEASLDELLAD
jgi:hypothetical protein